MQGFCHGPALDARAPELGSGEEGARNGGRREKLLEDGFGREFCG